MALRSWCPVASSRLWGYAAWFLAVAVVLVSGVFGGSSAFASTAGCSAGWTDHGDDTFGECRYETGLVLADRSAAVAWADAHSAAVMAGTSLDDVIVRVVGDAGRILGDFSPAYTGDSGPFPAYAPPCTWLCRDDAAWSAGFVACPCTVRLYDYGQDHGDAGPAFGPSSAVQSALVVFAAGSGASPYSDAAIDPVGGGGGAVDQDTGASARFLVECLMGGVVVGMVGWGLSYLTLRR